MLKPPVSLNPRIKPSRTPRILYSSIGTRSLLPCARLGVGSKPGSASTHPRQLDLSPLCSNWLSYALSNISINYLSEKRFQEWNVSAWTKIPFTRRTILSGDNTKGVSLIENNIKRSSFISSTTSLTILDFWDEFFHGMEVR
jgi:hypothetical protein